MRLVGIKLLPILHQRRWGALVSNQRTLDSQDNRGILDNPGTQGNHGKVYR